MPRRERDILERAVQTVAEQAQNTSAIVDEAHDAGLDGSHPVTLQAKTAARTTQREGRSGTGTWPARSELLRLRDDGPLGFGPGRHAGTLGAPRASAARRPDRVAAPKLATSRRYRIVCRASPGSPESGQLCAQRLQ
jgi:hypothetical protein